MAIEINKKICGDKTIRGELPPCQFIKHVQVGNGEVQVKSTPAPEPKKKRQRRGGPHTPTDIEENT